MERKFLDDKAIACIEKAVQKGNSVEIRKRKNDIVILEVSGKLIHSIPIKISPND